MPSWEPVLLGLLTAAVLIWMVGKLELLRDALNKRPLVSASVFLVFSVMTGVFLVAYWGELRSWHVAVMVMPLIMLAWGGFGVLFRWPGFRDGQRSVSLRWDLRSEEPFAPIPVPPAAPEREGRQCSRLVSQQVDHPEDEELAEGMHGDQVWVQERITEDGHEFVVQSEGSAPIAERIERWNEIDRRLPELVQTAIAAVVDPGPGLPGFSRSSRSRCRHGVLDSFAATTAIPAIAIPIGAIIRRPVVVARNSAWHFSRLSAEVKTCVPYWMTSTMPVAMPTPSVTTTATMNRTKQGQTCGLLVASSALSGRRGKGGGIGLTSSSSMVDQSMTCCGGGQQVAPVAARIAIVHPVP